MMSMFEGSGGRVAIAKTGHVLGVQDTIKNLRAVGVTMTQSAIRKALMQAAIVIRDDARRRVEVRTGSLKKAIIAETRGIGRDKKGRPSRHVAAVTIDRKAYTKGKNGRYKGGKRLVKGQIAVNIVGKIYPRNYAHLLEYGTRPHSLGRGSRRMMKKSRTPGEQTGNKHPGARPKPFMRPAFDTKRAAAEARFAEVIRDEAAKAVAKAKVKKTKGRR